MTSSRSAQRQRQSDQIDHLIARYGERVPRMMNAGSSETGRLFAIRHSDMHFDAVETPEASTARIAETKRLARAHGREIHVWTPVGIVCRPTQKEADDDNREQANHCRTKHTGKPLFLAVGQRLSN